MDKLDRSIKWLESGRSLRSHQLKSLSGAKSSRDLELSVTSSETVCDVQVARTLSSCGRTLVLLTSAEVGMGVLDPGTVIKISPPYCRLPLPGTEAEAVVGVTHWTTVASPPSHMATEAAPAAPGSHVQCNRLCECQTGNTSGPCPAAEEYRGNGRFYFY